MERILQILGIGGITFFLIFWISGISKGCNPNKNATKTEQTVQASDSINDEDIDLDEDIFAEGETNEKNTAKNEDETTSSGKDENIDDFIDYSGDVKEEKSKKSTSKTYSTVKKSKEVKQSYSSTNNGSYLVVAGSYLVRNNADKMKRRLNRLGYNSEIVNFDLSQYYSVLAGRFSSRSDAKETVSILKRNRIDSYVHRKK